MTQVKPTTTEFTLGTSSKFSGLPENRYPCTDNMGVVMVAITGFSKQAVARAQNGSGRDRSDDALIRAIADGDRSAMRVLHTRHHMKIYRFILRIIDDATLAMPGADRLALSRSRRSLPGFSPSPATRRFRLGVATGTSNSTTKSQVRSPTRPTTLKRHRKDRYGVIWNCLSQLSNEHR